MGNRSARCAPQGVYRCAGQDEWCAVSVHDGGQWRALAKVIGDAELATADRFATLQGRTRHHDELDERIEAWTRRLPSPEVEARVKEAGVPAARMRRVQDLVEDGEPSGAYKRMAESRVGSMLTTALPIDFSGCSLPAANSAPELGQHTREVLRDWLQLSDGEMAAIDAEGALV